MEYQCYFNTVEEEKPNGFLIGRNIIIKYRFFSKCQIFYIVLARQYLAENRHLASTTEQLFIYIYGFEQWLYIQMIGIVILAEYLAHRVPGLK